MAVRDAGSRKTVGNVCFATFLAGTLSLTVWDFLIRGGHLSTEIVGPVYALFVGLALVGFGGLLVLVATGPRASDDPDLEGM